jgi:photosystem II stability/assembly factor-like uncharacterized protein
MSHTSDKEEMPRMPRLSRLAAVVAIGFMVLAAGFQASLAVAQEHATKGGGPFEHVHALAIHGDGRSLLLGAHTGLFRSEDGGKSWQPVTLSAKHAHLDVMSIAPDPNDPLVIYVGTHEMGVLKSTDGGTTWTEVNTGLAGLDVHGLAVDPTAPGKLHAAVREKGEGLYRTTDGGAKWIRVDDGPGGEVKVLASVNIATGMGGIWLYAGTAEGLQRDPDCF